MITDDDLRQEFDAEQQRLEDDITKIQRALDELEGLEAWEAFRNNRKLQHAAKMRELAILMEIRRRLSL